MTDLSQIINRLEDILIDLKSLESRSIEDVTYSQQDWIDFWENTNE